ncbi:unnamed protein product, partial [Mesorhabditis spiculigera]
MLGFDPARRKMLHRSQTYNEALLQPERKRFALNFGLNRSANRSLDSSDSDDSILEEKSFIWDWPFSADRIAQGMYTKEKFVVILPFNKGGTGDKNGTTKKFDRIAESNFSWSLGLSRDDKLQSTCFWRLEIEIQRDLNALVLVASRDISRYDDKTKRLKRVRKVYRLPEYYDVATTTTTMFDWAVVVEARKRHINRPTLRRGTTLC